MTETVAVKVDESRREFEAWVCRINPDADLSIIEGGTDDGEYIDGYHAGLFAAWSASRAALVVELPIKRFIEEESLYIPEDVDWPDGFNTALVQCSDAIRAAGITVKGDSDETNANAS